MFGPQALWMRQISRFDELETKFNQELATAYDLMGKMMDRIIALEELEDCGTQTYGLYGTLQEAACTPRLDYFWEDKPWDDDGDDITIDDLSDEESEEYFNLAQEDICKGFSYRHGMGQ